MAIAFDTAANGSNDAGTSFNFDIVGASGASETVCVAIHNGAGDTLNSITANGNAMTLADKRGSPVGEYAYLYYLAIGTQTGGNVTIAMTRSSGAGARFRASAGTWSGTTGAIDQHSNASSGSNPVTCTITPTVSNSWAIIGGGTTDPCSASTNTTQRANAGGILIGDSNGTISSGSPYSQSITTAATVNLAAAQCNLIEGSQAGGVNSSFFMFFG